LDNVLCQIRQADVETSRKGASPICQAQVGFSVDGQIDQTIIFLPMAASISAPLPHPDNGSSYIRKPEANLLNHGIGNTLVSIEATAMSGR
jgi:hypothetical protein